LTQTTAIGRWNSYNAVILTYHSIDASGSVISTAPSRFHEQMRRLQGSSYEVVSLNRIVTAVRERQPIEARMAAITFDDGYRNFYDQAYPVLKDYGFPATVFVVPGLWGKRGRWKGQPEGSPDLELMGRQELVELSNMGIDFGAHSLTHPNLTTLPLTEAVKEVVDSKAQLEQHMSREVRFFAYPFGAFDSDIRNAVSEVFLGACSTKMDFTGPLSDPYALPRIDMYYFSRNNLFSWLGSGWFKAYILLRKAIRSSRPFFKWAIHSSSLSEIQERNHI
jgi:peptidoglycan/xylan/chitin deacetylase (PgdA/CDA1 family)